MTLSKLQFASFLSALLSYLSFFICYIGISISAQSIAFYFIPFSFMLISLMFIGGIFLLQAKYHKLIFLIASFLVSAAKVLFYLLWFYYVDYPELSTFFKNGSPNLGNTVLSVFEILFAVSVLISFFIENLSVTLYFFTANKSIKKKVNPFHI